MANKFKFFKVLLITLNEVWYFVGLLAAWLIIWSVSGVNITSWKGIALFVSILFLVFLKPAKDLIDDKIERRNNDKQ